MNPRNKYPEELFTPSGCLNRTALELLATCALGEDAAKLAESHIKNCEFCSDALTGLKLLLQHDDLKGFDRRMNRMEERITRQVENSKIATKVSQPAKLKVPAYRWALLAATLLILFGIYYLLKLRPEVQQPSLAVEKSLSPTELPAATDTQATPPQTLKQRVKFVPPAIRQEIVIRDEDVLQKNAIEAQELITLNSDKSADELDHLAIELAKPNNESTESSKNQEPDKGQEAVNDTKLAANQKRESTVAGITAVNESSRVAEELSDKSFSVVEEMPAFPGGQAKMMQFLAANIKYPKAAIENGISGTVYISFIVDRKGKINDVRVLRGIGGGCDEEAIRVVKSMPDWIPGKQNGKKVPVQFNLPIRFVPQ
jgi:TonB family protein